MKIHFLTVPVLLDPPTVHRSVRPISRKAARKKSVPSPPPPLFPVPKTKRALRVRSHLSCERRHHLFGPSLSLPLFLLQSGFSPSADFHAPERVASTDGGREGSSEWDGRTDKRFQIECRCCDPVIPLFKRWSQGFDFYTSNFWCTGGTMNILTVE